MSLIRINELQAITTVADTNVLPIVDTNNSTKKVSVGQLKSHVIADITNLHFEVVQVLPTQDIQTNVIYLVPKQTTGTNDIYTEYIYVNNTWEKLGETQIDLSNYVTMSSLAATLLDYATTSYVTTAINAAIGDVLGGSF